LDDILGARESNMKELVGGLVHFAGSDVTATLTKKEMENAPVTFSNKGARMMRTKAQDILIFGGTNMSVIKPIWKEVEEDDKPVLTGEGLKGDTPLDQAYVDKVNKTLYVEKDVLNPKVLVKPKPKTAEEAMDEITAKSNCKHEPEKLELFIQHTAKGIRYFPVCKFCGKRERYVSESKIVEGKYEGTPNEKWTEEDIATAQPWIED
jgi:hypothetical protein